MPTDNERMRRIERAQMRVVYQLPFFVAGVAKLPVVWDDSIPTACTDGKRIRFSRQFCDHCKDQELVTVLCEEVGHCLLGHLWRVPPGADWQTWNMACDQAVRLMMREYGETITAQKLADPFPFPDPEQSAPSDRYRGMAEETIYGLMSQNSGGSSNQGGQGNAGGGKPGQSGGQGKPGPQKGNQPGSGRSGSGQQKPFAEFEKPQAADNSEARKQQSDWQNTLLQSVHAAKGRGDLPGGLVRLVDELVNPRVPWVEILRTWLREKVEDDWNWMRPNQYFDGSGFILPSLESDRVGTVVFATDTSGSIDQEALRQFQSEKQACLDDLKPIKLVDLCCDTRITSEKEYRLGDQIDREAPGGGGTDFRPVFERAADMLPSVKCLVYLTDMDGRFPENDPGFPVLWVTWARDKKAPFGEVIEASRD